MIGHMCWFETPNSYQIKWTARYFIITFDIFMFEFVIIKRLRDLNDHLSIRESTLKAVISTSPRIEHFFLIFCCLIWHYWRAQSTSENTVKIRLSHVKKKYSASKPLTFLFGFSCHLRHDVESQPLDILKLQVIKIGRGGGGGAES